MLDKVTWPVVALVGLVLAAIVTMTALSADTASITNLLLLLGLGTAGGVLAGVKNNVNGNIARLVDLLGDAQNKLHHSTPDATDDDRKVDVL